MRESTANCKGDTDGAIAATLNPFVQLVLNPLDSKAFRHLLSFEFTPSLDSSTNTISFANNIHHGAPFEYEQLTHL